MAKAIKKQALGRGLSALLQDPKKDTQTPVSSSSSPLQVSGFLEPSVKKAANKTRSPMTKNGIIKEFWVE